MAWQTLEPEEKPLLWWIWKQNIGKPLEGYWGGVHKHINDKGEEARVLLVFDPVNEVWYRAFVSGALKRYRLDQIPTGARVKITAVEMDSRIKFLVQYDPDDTQVLELPLEYSQEEEVDF